MSRKKKNYHSDLHERCALTGKSTKGKEVIIASEILDWIEKQGGELVILKRKHGEIKSINKTKNMSSA